MTDSKPKPSEIEGHVFVVTYGRSGSTLVQNLLNSIPGYCIRGENNNALGMLARSWHEVQGNTILRNLASNGVETTAEHPWFGGENIDAARLGRSLARVFSREILSPPPGTRVSGFKEIRWTNEGTSLPVALNFLVSFLKNSRFIFNTRDHDEVVRSGWWASMDPDKVKAKLVKAEAAYDHYMTRHPERCLHIHYNDYVADHGKLRAMFDFLGEAFDPDRVAAVMGQELTHLKDNTT